MLPNHSAFKDRLPSIALTLAIQVGLFAILIFSFERITQLAPQQETIITLSPLIPKLEVPPQVIDARGKQKQIPLTTNTALPKAPVSPNSGATLYSVPPTATAPPNSLENFAAPDVVPSPSPFNNELHMSSPPSQNEKQWEADLQKKEEGGALLGYLIPDSKELEIGHGPADTYGITVTLYDPFCQLATAFEQGDRCSPREAKRIYTDTQFETALDAVNKRYRAGTNKYYRRDDQSQ